MASRPWSDEETAVLRSVAESPTWYAVAAARIDRSRSSIFSQMVRVRRELGLSPGKVGRPAADDWQPEAAAASAMLLEAIQRAGLRP